MDVDGDGDIDFIEGNSYDAPGDENAVWTNTGSGTFIDSGQALGDDDTNSICVLDADGDGDTDFISGDEVGNGVWLNEGDGTFIDSGQSSGYATTSAVFCVDIDSDGDTDFIEGNGGRALPDMDDQLWINDGEGTFSIFGKEIDESLTVSIIGADVDSDGDVDIVRSSLGPPGIEVWFINERIMPGTAPSTPAGLDVVPDPPVGTSVTLSWSGASDFEMEDSLLTYNLAFSTQPGVVDSSAVSSFPGNVGATTSWPLKNLATGTTYYWSVQAVDSGYAHSEWAAEQSFSIPE